MALIAIKTRFLDSKTTFNAQNTTFDTQNFYRQLKFLQIIDELVKPTD